MPRQGCVPPLWLSRTFRDDLQAAGGSPELNGQWAAIPSANGTGRPGMRDFLLVAVVLSTSTAIGYPACLLFPPQQFKVRLVAAPVIGFSVLAAAAIVFYPLGVPPTVSIAALTAAGLCASFLDVLRRRPKISSLQPTVLRACTVAGVVLLCLLPAWIGGPQFTVFQGNVYDQINVYLPGSVVFHQYDHGLVIGADGQNPIIADAKFALHRPISIVHAAFGHIAHSTAAGSAYAFMVALQVNMLFAALFVAVHVFELGHRLSLLVSAAVTVGFFQQYVFDIDAWSQLASQPIYLMILAVAVLATDFERFGRRPVVVISRVAALFAPLMTAVMLLYPDSLVIYGVAGTTACLLGMTRAKRKTTVSAAAGLSLGTAGALVLSWWYGIFGFLFSHVLAVAVRKLDWWKYFDRYLFGREQNYLANLGRGTGSSWPAFYDSLFSLPAEAVIAGMGLYYFLPTAAWPLSLAVAWKLLLCLTVAMALAAIARAVMESWRQNPASAQSGMIAGCIAGCLVPFMILLTDHLWAAGKALSIAWPLLFFLIATPLAPGLPVWPAGRLACLAIVLGHLITGALRPILVKEAGGATIPGLPGSGAAVETAKAGMDWEVDRWAQMFRTCKAVIMDIEQPFMNKIAQLVATDIGARWASMRPLSLGGNETAVFRPPGWEQADCVASDGLSDLRAGRRVIWLMTDGAVPEFLQSRSGALEIATERHPGITAGGVYEIEKMPQGPLRWTSADARFQVANASDAPAVRLVLTLWPMPLAADVRLALTINQSPVFARPVPGQPVTVPLEAFAKDDLLRIELKTAPVTRYPHDPRELGVALRALRLEK